MINSMLMIAVFLVAPGCVLGASSAFPTVTSIHNLVEQGAKSGLVNGHTGLATVEANCGDNDDPQPKPERFCGSAVKKIMDREALYLHLKFTEDDALEEKVICREWECVVPGNSEWSPEEHFLFEPGAKGPQLVAVYGLCAINSYDEDKIKAIKTIADLRVKPCP